MLSPKRIVFLGSVLLILLTASVPRVITYQGKLLDSATNTGVNDTLSMTFQFYDASTGGSLLWEENIPEVVIYRGLFSVILGESDNFDTLSFGRQYWIQVIVEGDLISPREKLRSVPYALRASVAENVIGGANGWIDDGGIVRLVNATDKVGMGLGSPRTELEVYGRILAGESENGILLIEDKNAPSGERVKFIQSDNGRLHIGKSDDGLASLSTQATIDNFGNLGLGTEDPQARLDVNGQMYSRIYNIPWPSR